MNDTASGPTTIVVGVDGSEQSKEALRWAARQARLCDTALEVVTCWELPISYGWPYPLPADLDLAGDAAAALAATVEEVLGSEHPGLELHQRTLSGPPGQALVDAAEGADLLVVGSRGHGALAGVLLGSVSQHCVCYSPCPVVVVNRPRHHVAAERHGAA
ncbi:MAG TPA: universal stress protein [Acidimicrobiales bacterium]|nr:universal stress protein [Acidimicrobiales bacterium]